MNVRSMAALLVWQSLNGIRKLGGVRLSSKRSWIGRVPGTIVL
jgi:hypothetical protein